MEEPVLEVLEELEGALLGLGRWSGRKAVGWLAATPTLEFSGQAENSDFTAATRTIQLFLSSLPGIQTRSLGRLPPGAGHFGPRIRA
jgi:hypothetical protein